MLSRFVAVCNRKSYFYDVRNDRHNRFRLNFSSTEIHKILRSFVRNLQISAYWVKNSLETTPVNCESITWDLVSNCSDVWRIALFANVSTVFQRWINHCAVDNPISFCRKYPLNSDLSSGKV